MRQWAKRAAWPAAGLALGLAVFLAVYGPLPLEVTNDSWLLGGYVETDLLQHYAGWLAIKNQGLSWPLTFTAGLDWPVGGAAALADCIPLLAVPFGLVRAWLPATFQYFGWFVCGSLMLQGEAAVRLVRLFTKRAPCVLAGAALLCVSPVLLERAFRHTALSAHWLILYALYLYFKSARGGFAKMPAGGFIALAALAAAIHLYFVPMVLAIALACGISAGLAARRWRGPLLGVGSAVLAALAAAWALGFFSVKGSEAGGYGSFGMNLNALWNPVSLDWNWWVPGQGQLCWSRVLPVRPLAGNSLEAFNYLGLGLLAAGAACGAALLGALALKRLAPRRLWRFAKRHLPLAAVCALLTAFAVSNVVTANSRTLLELPLPGPLLALCDVFRASGRMFWPVWYLLALAAVVLLARLPRKGMAAGTLALVLAVQLFDLSGALGQKRAWFAGVQAQPPAAVLTQEEEALLAGAAGFFALEACTDRPLAAAVQRCGPATNIRLLARGSGEALEARIGQVREALLQGEQPLPGTVYYTADEALADQVAARFPAGRKTLFYQGWLLCLG